MCPDRRIVSLYFDRELPSPWKEKMEAHLDACPECRAVLAGYQNLAEGLRHVPTRTIEAAQERVWEKLAATAAGEKPAEESRDRAVYRRTDRRLWNRTITLPLPAAAAAAALVIIVFLALLAVRGETRPPAQDLMASTGFGLDNQLFDQDMFPMQDMNGVLQYLSSQNNGDFMIIRLPESRSFSRTGEPALINAADYSRSWPFR
jgi:hypothetical protein